MTVDARTDARTRWEVTAAPAPMDTSSTRTTASASMITSVSKCHLAEMPTAKTRLEAIAVLAPMAISSTGFCSFVSRLAAVARIVRVPLDVLR